MAETSVYLFINTLFSTNLLRCLWFIFTTQCLMAISVGQPDNCRYPCATWNWNSKCIPSDTGAFHATTLSRRPESLYWRHNERDSFSNPRRLDCLLNRLFSQSKEMSKLRVTGFVKEFTGDRGIPLTAGQKLHLMTSWHVPQSKYWFVCYDLNAFVHHFPQNSYLITLSGRLCSHYCSNGIILYYQQITSWPKQNDPRHNSKLPIGALKHKLIHSWNNQG